MENSPLNTDTNSVSPAVFPETDRSGQRVGNYRLLEKLGEGGFGVVYSAMQEEPIKRHVAIKLIKPGHDTKEVIQRFVQERQSLAMMDHPSIAKVYDAGETDLQHPYFVMELVHGQTICDYCDSSKMNATQRLELFIQVCQAVGHAHQKGVIHRDIKPSNILIAIRENRPIPKVIDFGIAKAIGPGLSANSLKTSINQIIGTPQYMSPEQANSGSDNLDIRSDIYSLGVVLYELLTGETPLRRQDLEKRSVEEVLKIIREEEVPKPSSKITAKNGDVETVADNRQSTPRRLERLLQGDLDWILMKSVHKDPSFRYESALAFAKDIRAHLDGDPIEARAPSLRYKTQKFLAKNLTLVLTVLAFTLTLVIATVTSVLWAMEAIESSKISRQSALKEKKLRQSAVEAKESAVEAKENEKKQRLRAEKATKAAEVALEKEQEKRKALEAISGFTNSILSSPDPAFGGRHLTVGQLLLVKKVEIQQSFPGDPKTKATMLVLLAPTFANLGLREPAIELLEEGLGIREKLYKEDEKEILETLDLLAEVYSPDYNKAMQYAKRFQKATAQLEDDDPWKVKSKLRLIRAYYGLDQISQAEKLANETLGLIDPIKEDYPKLAHKTYLELSEIYSRRSQFKKALGILRKSLKVADKVPGDNGLNRKYSELAIATNHLNQQKYQLAADSMKPLVKELTDIFGQDHANVISLKIAYSKALFPLGQDAKASQIIQDAIKSARKTFGPNSNSTYSLQIDAANMLVRNRQTLKAVKMYAEVYPKIRKFYGADHWETIDAGKNYAQALMMTANHMQAGTLALQLHKVCKERWRKENPNKKDSEYLDNGPLRWLAASYIAQNKAKDAVAFTEHQYQLRLKVSGPNDSQTIESGRILGQVYSSVGDFSKAKKVLNECYRRCKENGGPDVIDPWVILVEVSMVECENRDYQAAVETGRIATKNLSRIYHPNHPIVLDAKFQTLKALGEIDSKNAIMKLQEVLDAIKSNPKNMAILYWKYHQVLIKLLRKTGDNKKLYDAYQTVLNYLDGKIPTDHMYVLRTQYSLGSMQLQMRMKEVGRENLLKAERGFKSKKYEGDHRVILKLSNVGNTLMYEGLLEDAARIQADSVKAMRKVKGEGDPNSLHVKLRLASCYERMNKDDAALGILLPVKDLVASELGKGHQWYIAAGNRIGLIYIRRKDYANAEKVYSETVPLAEIHLGTKDEITTDMMFNYGRSLLVLKKHKEALKVIDRLLKIEEKKYGEQDPRVNLTRFEIIRNHLVAHNFQKAKEWYDVFLSYSENHNKSQFGGNAQAVTNAGRTFFNNKQYKFAVHYAERGLKLVKEKAANTWLVGDIQSFLGIAMVEKASEMGTEDLEAREKLLKSAEKELLSGYDILVRRTGGLDQESRNKFLQAAARRIVRLYELWKKPKKVLEWKKKARSHNN